MIAKWCDKIVATSSSLVGKSSMFSLAKELFTEYFTEEGLEKNISDAVTDALKDDPEYMAQKMYKHWTKSYTAK